MKRPRLRKWAKWACTIAAVLAAGLAVFSRFYKFQAFGFFRNDSVLWVVSVDRGLLYAGMVVGVRPVDVASLKRWKVARYSGWYWGTKGDTRYASPRSTWNGGVLWSRDASGWGAGVSVLYPLLATTIPASFLWYTDRRRPRAGHCAKCNYDRRGLAPDANCPECGTTPGPHAYSSATR
jgi:hypothetical protein